MRRLTISLGIIAALILGSLAPAIAAANWTTVSAMSSVTPSDSNAFSFAISKNGLIVSQTWVDDGTPKLRVSQDGGTTWGATTSFGAGPIGLVQVHMSENGATQYLMWSKRVGLTSTLYTLTSTDYGATWPSVLAATQLGTNIASPHGLQVSVSADGARAIAIWHAKALGDLDTSVITRSTANSGARWSAAVVHQPGGYTTSDAQVSMSSDGNRAVIAYKRSPLSGSSSAVTHITSDGGATWAAAVKISTLLGNAQRPRIAMSADGVRVHAIWTESYSNGTGQVYHKISNDSGARWSATTRMNDASRMPYPEAIVTSSDGSRTTAVWSENAGDAFRTYVKSSADAGASFGSMFRLRADLTKGGITKVRSSSDGLIVGVLTAAILPSTGPVQLMLSTNGGASWAGPTDLSSSSYYVTAASLAFSADGLTQMAQWAAFPVDESHASVALLRSTDAVQDAEANGGGDSAGGGGAVAEADKAEQTTLSPLTVADSIRRKGKTRVISVPIPTNAGQNASVSLAAVVKSTGKVAKKRDFKVVAKKKFYRVITKGRKTLIVTLQVNAPATDAYRAYVFTKTYTVKKKR